MPEETLAPEADAPDKPEAPESGSQEGTTAPQEATETASAPDPKLQESYDNLRSDYTQKTQRLSELENFYNQLTDPEQQAAVLQALGIEAGSTEEDSDEYIDPDERLDRLEQQLAEERQTAQQAKDDAELEQLEAGYLDEEIAKLEKEHGKLSDKERNVLKRDAKALRNDEGFPQVEQAFQDFVDAAEARHERYLQSKKTPKVAPGAQGEEIPDLSSDDKRREYMRSILEGEEST